MGSSIDTDDLGVVRELAAVRGLARRSLGQIIYEALRRGITRGEIQSGHRLVEERLARGMGASRTPVREALQRLEQERLIQKLPYGGYEVNATTLREIEEIFGIRSILESHAAVLATRRIQGEVMEALEAIIADSRRTLDQGEIEQFIELNTEFHDRLYRASDSERLCAMINQLRDHFYRYRRVILLCAGMPETSLRDHELMMEAMRGGDERGVETLVREHVLRGMTLVLQEIREGRLGI